MKSRSAPPPEAQEILSRAPHLFTDREELRLAMRAEIVKPDDKCDTNRYEALKKRDDQLQAQWDAQNPEKVAEIKSEQQEDEERYNENYLKDLEESNPKAAQIIMRSNRRIEKSSNRELEALTKAEITEVKARRLENRFGLPHGQTDFNPRELYEIAQRNGYEAQIRAFYGALEKHEFGGGVRLSFGDAEEFLSVLLSKQRRKRAP